MRMCLAVQQFCGTLADAFGSIATQEATMVEKKTQQMQIIVADMPAQEKIVPQATIEVLDNGL